MLKVSLWNKTWFLRAFPASARFFRRRLHELTVLAKNPEGYFVEYTLVSWIFPCYSKSLQEASTQVTVLLVVCDINQRTVLASARISQGNPHNMVFVILLWYDFQQEPSQHPCVMLWFLCDKWLCSLEENCIAQHDFLKQQKRCSRYQSDHRDFK